MKKYQILGIILFLSGLSSFGYLLLSGKFNLTDQVLLQVNVKPKHLEILRGTTYDLKDVQCNTPTEWNHKLNKWLRTAQYLLDNDWNNNGVKNTWKEDEWSYRISDNDLENYRYQFTKISQIGSVVVNSDRWLFLTFGLCILGALFYNLPRLRLLAGIKNNGIYHSSLHSRGILGIAIGLLLIGFYVLLYWYPIKMISLINLVDPISRSLSGNAASQWFLYGLLYTICMWVMGIRMAIKYRHNNYQLVRTASVVFFQTIFAFLLPEILMKLNQPYVDLKNMWPLDYSFFFDYRIDEKIKAGTFGMFAFVWGIILFTIGVPVLTYLYGKRWYCSWVCGCGGLAETLGDPFRQLSSKKLIAWQIERYLVNSVLVFAVIMTGLVLYTYFTGNNNIGPLGSYDARKWYGFLIGSIFAGVVGTGFYPLMGNRVWCRFGCPLAAWLGIVQRFKSRFRITVNGGQCISCGNCSTYCEMGIDVRSYAQKGQDIVRASCVGCGICAAVCPRGVLRLENASNDPGQRADKKRTVFLSADQVGVIE